MAKKKKAFSKSLLVQESFLVWIVTIAVIGLAYLCVLNGYMSELPWLTAMVGCPWAAYGVSQAFYYQKSKCENTKDGIVYESAMASLNIDSDDDEAAG